MMTLSKQLGKLTNKIISEHYQCYEEVHMYERLRRQCWGRVVGRAGLCEDMVPELFCGDEKRSGQP